MEKRILGIALIIGGAALLYWGYSESQGVASQLTDAISGDPGDNVMLKYIGGAISFVVGIYLVK